MRWMCIVTGIAWFVAVAGAAWAGEGFEAPVRVKAGGEAIDVTTGHAAPLLFDFDRDGKRDLLVGQMGGGKLRIYKNVGTDTDPRFEDFEPLKIGETDATVPSG